jgi:SAM-dependent methyltransferase
MTYYLVLFVQGIVVLVAFALYGSMFLTIFTNAPYVPMRRRELKRLLSLAKISAGDRVVDLGSGDGKLVLAAAEAGAQAIGVERQPLLVWGSRVRAHLRGLDGRATFVRGNLFAYDLREADIVCCYLMPKAMARLQEKFERELKPGARVLSNAFSIPGWEPATVDRDGKTAPIFLYIKR